MSVLVDTPIWSLSFRRARTATTSEGQIIERLSRLVRIGDALILGATRQEILTGIPSPERYADIRDRLRAIPDVELVRDDYERAAEFANRCRGRGIATTSTDILLCAVAKRLAVPVLTLDRDFERFRDILGVELEPVS